MLLEIKTTRSSSNFQNAVCSISQNLLLFLPKSGQSGSAITHSRKLRPLVQLQITNMLYVQFRTLWKFKHSIGSKQICHLIILLEIKTTNSTANFQNVVCLISHHLLLNHPIGLKRICHHSKLLLETETTNSTANFLLHSTRRRVRYEARRLWTTTTTLIIPTLLCCTEIATITTFVLWFIILHLLANKTVSIMSK